MKNLKLLSIFFLVFGFYACENDDDETIDDDDSTTIASFVAASPNHESLEAALDRAGLTSALDGSGSLTLFAPDDNAFAQFLADNGFADLDAVPVDVLTNLLNNHLINSGAVQSGDLATGYVNTAAVDTDNNNLSLFVNIDGGVELNGVSTVTGADNVVDNGVVHVVDGVIGLPTVATLAAADPNFATLVVALDQENLVGALQNTDPNAAVPAPYTVFAPTEDAFAALINEDPNLNDASDVLALPNLTDILLYHVIAGSAVREADIPSGTPVATAEGSNITIDTSSGAVITDGQGRSINIIATNVTAINGVIHAIDNVLLP